MSEREWLAGEDPLQMFLAARGMARSIRKETLLGLACCRHLDHLLTDPRSQAGLTTIMEVADGALLDERRVAVLAAVREVSAEVLVRLRASWEPYEPLEDQARWLANNALAQLAGAIQPYFVENTAAFFGDLVRSATYHAGEGHWNLPGPSWAAALVREVYGNPFRPVSLTPAVLTWQDATVPALAQAIYAEQAWERLPILADALEEAGCDNADLLRHCRGWEPCPMCIPGGQCRTRADICDGSGWILLRAPHVPGCWAVDLLLGKA